MEIYKTKQLFIMQLEHPLEAVNQIFFKNNNFEKYCQDGNFKIKKFLGSDWSIKDSGLIFYGPNDLNIVFSLIHLEINDFNRINKYLVTHLNGKKMIDEIIFILSLFRNTTDNNTIVEIRLEYDCDTALNNIKKKISFSSFETLLKRIFSRVNNYFNDKSIDKNKDLLVNHSFIIKKNYKEAFYFFYNVNNVAKSIKTDKVWKIINNNNEENSDNYKDFYIIVNDNITIHYQVVSIEEISNEKIEIVYNKTSNSSPSLNNYIKFSFFNIANDICFFLYETHLPSNLSSSIYQTVSNYLFYCNKKSKDYIENL